MEENALPPFVEGRIMNIRFSIATDEEIRISSISEGPIYHASQLTNPFLGLPLESGKCESCGTAEPGKCEGHFGYIELPTPIYHPNHVTELKKLLTLVCLKCLRLKRVKNVGSDKSSNKPCLYCQDLPRIGINETKTTDGVVLLELKLAGRSQLPDGGWNFMDRYGYHYGEGRSRTLLPCEVLEILKRFPEETRKKLSGKAYFTQDGYILQKLPVPPNCLSIPDISDGVSIMSSDISISMLRKVLKQVEIIKSSRCGRPNFESHRVEVNDLQSAVAQYLRARGTAKDSRDIKMRSGMSKEADDSATKAWLEKMKTYFISKGSGYCSRSVITGDAYKKVNEIGLPIEVAQRITFEEKVTECNKVHLQELVDKKLCLTYRDGASLYSLREGSKGHTLLKVGQVVHRRIMDGDVVFINRPPSTHKHSLQALSVYVHEDHTVKINPLICGPLDADFDGDCVHLFYPQSLAARAEVLELFSVEQQLLSSHSGSLNLQLKNDSLLSLKIMFKNFFLDKVTAQQLAMSISTSLPQPALLKANFVESKWTVLQILQTALPDHFDCVGERYSISQTEILRIDFNKDMLQSMFHEIISSVFFEKGSKEALNLLNSLQPLLMESLFSEGYSVSLKDFSIPKSFLEDLPRNIQDVSALLHQLRSTYNELVELQVGNHLRSVKAPVVNFILKLSGLGNLIDSKSESAINKVVEQIGFLGLQLADRGKFYSRNLVEDMTSLFLRKYAVDGVEFPSEAFGLIKSSFFHGLNPYEDLVHSISSREVLVRSSRGLTEPGTLFKNLMTILRDVVVCYDGTVRNVSSNSVIQFEYGVEAGLSSHRFYPAGEPVGALAATAISNPAYKAVLDSSSSSNASWELMKEILVCKINFVNDLNDRRVILYLNDCGCGKRHCKENAAYLVQNQLKKVSLRDISVDFLIEYQSQQTSPESSRTDTSLLVGHIHLDKRRLKDLDRSMHEVLLKCQENISLLRRKKKSLLVDFLKSTLLSVSECCCFQQSLDSEWCQVPCMQFSCRLDTNGLSLETSSQIMANMICPIMLDTIIKGDRRVCTANIIWISPDTTTWVKNQCRTHHGELALEIVLEKKFAKKHGDAWRLALDSCLPVIHLIDTRRSIPYAIRQVQEVLGISCAFDQAVQRLSTSIRMVNKGVLKEHLILAANSMTCTGSLIGFNKGGYRALFRSLNVQIPFTEATLFTPRKCFERAAEKCHTDTLSGIVASCSWGKHVAVGSGTHFEILWNKKEMGSDQNGVTDIYNFLQLVRTSSNGGESNTSCLGEDYDDLEIENRVADLSFSPEQNFENSKPTFDDGELQCDFEQDQTGDKGKSSESNWEKGISVVKSGGSSDAWGRETGPATGWDTTQLPSKEPVDAWGKQTEESDTRGWEKNVSSTLGQWNESHESHSTKASQESPKSVGWNTMQTQKQPPQSAHGDDWENRADAQWGQSVKSNTNHYKKSSAESSRSGDWNISESQEASRMEPCGTSGRKTEETKSSAWSQSEQVSRPTSSLGWDSPSATGWSKDDHERELSRDTWGKTAEETKSSSEWNQHEQVNRPTSSFGWNSESATGWTVNGKTQDEEEKRDLPSDDPWGKRSETKSSSEWSQHEQVNQSTSSLGWNSQSVTGWTEKGQTQNEQEERESPCDAWGKKTETKPSSEWSQHEQVNQLTSSLGWNSESATGWTGNEKTQGVVEKRDLPSDDPWGKKSETKSSSEWNQHEQVNQSTSSLGWNSQSATGWTEKGQTQNEQEKRESPCDAWGKKTETKPSSEWSQLEQVNQSTSSLGWGSPSATGWTGDTQDDQERNLPWGRGKKQSGRGWGSSNSGDWKQKNRPARSPGRFDDRNARGNFTPSRSRLDQYTPQEQKVYSEVDPIMQSLRRIMHQSGKNDGDPLSPDDQSYVLDNVFNYHPDKAVKMGAGIDYVMISKHSSFQETRCFYIVSTDARKEDFSYRKCMENFVKEKYPELAESFNGKYFRKPRGREANEQEQTPASQNEQEQTPASQQ